MLTVCAMYVDIAHSIYALPMIFHPRQVFKQLGSNLLLVVR